MGWFCTKRIDIWGCIPMIILIFAYWWAGNSRMWYCITSRWDTNRWCWPCERLRLLSENISWLYPTRLIRVFETLHCVFAMHAWWLIYINQIMGSTHTLYSSYHALVTDYFDPNALALRQWWVFIAVCCTRRKDVWWATHRSVNVGYCVFVINSKINNSDKNL